MDREALTGKFKQIFEKYKYVAFIVLLGLVLMSIPSAKEETEVQEPVQSEVSVSTPEQQLEHILAQIEGVGKVSVMLTESSGAETWYQTDQDSSYSGDSESLRIETVILSGPDRGEQGLVKRIDPPVYLGAIVVCEGAGRPSVQLAVVEAVSNVTGISADRITVLKMK